MTAASAIEETSTAKTLIRLAISLAIFITMLCMAPPAGLSVAAWHAAAVGILMALLWILEAMPIPATALIPLALFPILGVAPIAKAAAPFAHKLIFLFMGGFILAMAMERWNLHRRIALTILKYVGAKPAALVAGFMAATGFLSMWVSNTATATMMLPIALSVIQMMDENVDMKIRDKFGAALLLSIAYGASIGGVATLIGTPPNALLAGFMEKTYGYDISFGDWMKIGLPISVVLMIFAWFSLTVLSFPLKGVKIEGAQGIVKGEIAKLGPMSRGEKMVGMVFLLTAFSWVFHKPIEKYLAATYDITTKVSDTEIAIISALLLFMLPTNLKKGAFLIDWKSAQKLPWGVLVLFGGGLSLGAAITNTGLSTWIADMMGGLEGIDTLWLIAIFSVVVCLVSHMTSNTATAAAFLPLAASLALSLGENPLVLTVPTVLAASCVFMMPVATPPNAIVFASGKLTVPQMARAGFLINLVALVMLVAAAYGLLGMVFGVEMGVMPDWAASPAS